MRKNVCMPRTEEVKNLYDKVTSSFLEHYGNTFQGGIFEEAIKTQDTAELFIVHNLLLAERAGIADGMHILDCGCGVCGPSIDIASHYHDIHIDAITISPVQADIAQTNIQEANLADHIAVHIGDYHHLPFADGQFDRVMFLESAGYSYDMPKLFSEVFRVLKKGGKLYIKDAFCNDGLINQQQKLGLEEFCRIYIYQPFVASEASSLLEETGFSNVNVQRLDSLDVPISTKRYLDAQTSDKNKNKLNEFGIWQKSKSVLRHAPLYFADMIAVKPDVLPIRCNEKYMKMGNLFVHVRKECTNPQNSKYFLDDVLVSTSKLDQIQRVAYGMNDLQAQLFCIECNLGRGIIQGDFSFAINKKNISSTTIQSLENIKSQQTFSQINKWENINKFFTAWSQQNSLLHQCINTIYMEFDIDENAETMRQPGMFFKLNRVTNYKWYSIMVRAILNTLTIERSADCKKMMNTYFEKFGLLSNSFQFGVMLSRENAPLKMVAIRVPVDKIKESVAELGCNTLKSIPAEDWKAIEEMSAGSLSLSFEIGESVGERIGLEFSFPKARRNDQQKDSSEWRELFNWLVTKGYCTEDKRDAVFNWLGDSCYQLDANPANKIVVSRRLSHVKIDFTAKGFLQAKVYLEYKPVYT